MRQLILLALSLSFLSGCGVQSIPQSKNAMEAASGEIMNQYKRRADLIPNLVETVKGYAKHEESTLTEVTEARAKATSMNIDPSKATPEQVAKFQQAQGGLSQALGRLMVVSEKYPDLKANENFKSLQSQLEGTENRIAVARQRYIESVQEYNNQITVPPTSFSNSLFYHYDKAAQWGAEVTAEEKAAPKVKF